MSILWLILGATALYLFQRQIYGRFWDKGLWAGLEFERKSAVEGETCHLLERVENRKSLPLPMVKVKFQMSRNLCFADEGDSAVTDQYYRNDILSLGPNQRIIRKLPFLCQARGYYRIRGLDLVGTDLFLSREMVTEAEGGSTLYVYPRPAQGAELMTALRKLNGEIMAKRHVLEDPFEYRGIREYAPFDEMKSINWKATARMDDLMVNMRGYTSLKSVHVYVNLEDSGVWRRKELSELCIRIAARAAEELLGQGIRTAVYCNGRDILNGEIMRIPAAAGEGQMEGINRAFARLDADRTVPFGEAFTKELEKEERDTAILFVSVERGSRFVEILNRLAGRGCDFAWFCPLLAGMEAGVENPERLRFTRLCAEEMLDGA